MTHSLVDRFMVQPAYCPNCQIDILRNPSYERAPEFEPLDNGLVELRGYCDCGVLSYWTLPSPNRMGEIQPVLRLAVGNSMLHVPPKDNPLCAGVPDAFNFQFFRDFQFRVDSLMPKSVIKLDPGVIIKGVS